MISLVICVTTKSCDSASTIRVYAMTVIAELKYTYFILRQTDNSTPDLAQQARYYPVARSDPIYV